MPMLNINLPPMVEAGRVSKDQNVSLVHRQAWMQSLERTGLVDVLRQIRMMASSNSLPSNLLGSEQEVSNQSIKEEKLLLGQDALQTSKEEGSANIQALAIESNPRVMTLPSDTTSEVVQLMVKLTNDIQEERTYISKAKLSGADGEASVANKTQVRYLEQNVLMLNANTGIELWVRDMTLPKSKLIDMLKVVRQSMGMLGVSLVKVVLNGQEILSLNTKSNEKEASLI